MFYNISVKPHYGGNWTYYPTSYGETYPASNSEYSVRNFVYGAYDNGGYARGGYADTVSPQMGYVSPGGEVDFRVQAIFGYYHNEWVSMGGPDHPLLGGEVPMFTGESSDWSHTQTITIPETSASTSPTPNLTPTPSVPEFSWLAILPLFISLLSVAILLKLKHKKTDDIPLLVEKH